MNSSFTLMCLFSSLPGPPGFYFEGTSYLSLYPVNKKLCPTINPETDVIFELYTKYNRTTPEILLLDNDESIIQSHLDFTKVTVIYFHGFMENGKYGSAPFVRNAYMTRDDHNFITVNAERLLAGPWFFTAFENTKYVANYTAKMIDYLVDKGMDLKKIHLIGHSLGGVTAGYTGGSISRGRAARLTALDPANITGNKTIDKNDADFVDVIRTTFGFIKPVGHAEFFPNGGIKKQPGCHTLEILQESLSILEQVFCSHWRSYYFYAESVLKPNSFLSTPCDSWKDYEDGNCNSTNFVYMGYNTPNTARGKYYLRTNKDSPFSQNPNNTNNV